MDSHIIVVERTCALDAATLGVRSGMTAGTRGAKAIEEQTVQILTALQTQGQQQMEQMTRQLELLAANQQKQQKRATMEMREKLNQIERYNKTAITSLKRKLTEETSLLMSTQKRNGGPS